MKIISTGPSLEPSPPGQISEERKAFIAKWADIEVQGILLDEAVGMSDIPAPDYPLWVRRCAEKVNRALFPKVFEALEENKGSRFYQAGLAFGLMSAGQATLKPQLKKFREELGESGTATTVAQDVALLESFRSEKIEPVAVSLDGDMISPEMREKIRLIESGASPVELAEIYQGKHDAVSMMNGENKTTDTTAIYQLMLTYWRLVEQFPTAQRFFEFLTHYCPVANN